MEKKNIEKEGARRREREKQIEKGKRNDRKKRELGKSLERKKRYRGDRKKGGIERRVVGGRWERGREESEGS